MTSTTQPRPTTGPAPAEAPSGRVTRRRRQVADAAELRSYETDPDVVAWLVQRTQRLVEFVLYGGILAGFSFTVVNVQHFVSAGAAKHSPGWWASWGFEPMLAATLIAVLIASKALQKHGIDLGRWARLAGAVTALATYTMNTWASWAVRDVKQIVIHSIPPVVVFLAVEVIVELRDRFARAVAKAREQAEAKVRERLAAERRASAEIANAVRDERSGVFATTVRPDLEPAPNGRGSGTRTARSNAAKRPADGVKRAVNEAKKPRLTSDDVTSLVIQRLESEGDGGQRHRPTIAWIRELTGCGASTAMKARDALEHRFANDADGPFANGSNEPVANGSGEPNGRALSAVNGSASREEQEK